VSHNYSNAFYEEFKDSSRLSASVVVPLVMDLVRPNSVVDIGCGIGIWLSVFKEYGVQKITGVDGPWVDQKLLAIPKEHFIAKDISEEFSLDIKADLAICLEMAEHVPASVAENLVRMLTSIAPVVLFSAAIPHQGGSGHVNEQWPEYWAALFKKNGFIPVDCIRRKIWEDSRVSWFYAQNMFIYVSSNALTKYPALTTEVIAGFGSTPTLIHPYKYLYFAERWELLVPFLGKIPARVLHAAKRTLSYFATLKQKHL
jgi:SAM-dependent methyltransferase